jgi:hypothetical protein
VFVIFLNNLEKQIGCRVDQSSNTNHSRQKITPPTTIKRTKNPSTGSRNTEVIPLQFVGGHIHRSPTPKEMENRGRGDAQEEVYRDFNVNPLLTGISANFIKL